MKAEVLNEWVTLYEGDSAFHGLTAAGARLAELGLPAPLEIKAAPFARLDVLALKTAPTTSVLFRVAELYDLGGRVPSPDAAIVTEQCRTGRVFSRMFRPFNNIQVFRPVIGFNFVDVVNDFVGFERPAYFGLGDDSVFASPGIRTRADDDVSLAECLSSLDLRFANECSRLTLKAAAAPNRATLHGSAGNDFADSAIAFAPPVQTTSTPVREALYKQPAKPFTSQVAVFCVHASIISSSVAYDNTTLENWL